MVSVIIEKIAVSDEIRVDWIIPNTWDTPFGLKSELTSKYYWC